MREFIHAFIVIGTVLSVVAFLLYGTPWIGEAASYNARMARCYFDVTKCK